LGQAKRTRDRESHRHRRDRNTSIFRLLLRSPRSLACSDRSLDFSSRRAPARAGANISRRVGGPETPIVLSDGTFSQLTNGTAPDVDLRAPRFGAQDSLPLASSEARRRATGTPFVQRATRPWLSASRILSLEFGYRLLGGPTAGCLGPVGRRLRLGNVVSFHAWAIHSRDRPVPRRSSRTPLLSVIAN